MQIVLTETWHNVQSCNYVLDGYSLYFFSKHFSSAEFFEYDFVDSNIVNLYISNFKVPINLICVYKS